MSRPDKKDPGYARRARLRNRPALTIALEMKVYCSECKHFVRLGDCSDEEGLCGLTITDNPISKKDLSTGKKAAVMNAGNECLNYKKRNIIEKILHSIYS